MILPPSAQHSSTRSGQIPATGQGSGAPASAKATVDRVETFVFVLVPDFSMMSLTSAFEPLRSLNRLLGTRAYEWRFAGLGGDSVASSSGIAIPTLAFDAAFEGATYVFVCGGMRIQTLDERPYLAALRKAARLGIKVGSLSTGTYLLARAGLLDGYRCTIHWENRPAFQEEFFKLECTAKIYEIDRDRLTCSGGTASMDLVLHLIEERHGPHLASAVANQFHHERIRGEADSQRPGRATSLKHLPAHLREAIELMRSHIEEPLPLPQIAERVGVSGRQLERLFLRYFGKNPLRHYLELRLERARELLLYSELPIIDIAIQSGFTSTSHFASWYRRIYETRPSEAREPTPARKANPGEKVSKI